MAAASTASSQAGRCINAADTLQSLLPPHAFAARACRAAAKRKGTPYVAMRSDEGIFGMALLQKALMESEEAATGARQAGRRGRAACAAARAAVGAAAAGAAAADQHQL